MVSLGEYLWNRDFEEGRLTTRHKIEVLVPVTLECGAKLGGRVVMLPIAACQVRGVGLAIPWGFGAVEFLAVAAPLMGRLSIAARRNDQVVGLVAAREQAAVNTAFAGPVFADGWDAACRNGRRGGDGKGCEFQHHPFVRAADSQIAAGVGSQFI